MKILVLTALATALAGCATSASMSRASTYKQSVIHVKMPDDTYRLYEHKSEKVLMVAPSLSRIMSIGATQGATLGMVDTMTPEQRLENAAFEYLKSSGRGECKIVRGLLLQKPMYEFWYECPSTAATSVPLPT